MIEHSQNTFSNLSKTFYIMAKVEFASLKASGIRLQEGDLVAFFKSDEFGMIGNDGYVADLVCAISTDGKLWTGTTIPFATFARTSVEPIDGTIAPQMGYDVSAKFARCRSGAQILDVIGEGFVAHVDKIFPIQCAKKKTAEDPSGIFRWSVAGMSRIEAELPELTESLKRELLTLQNAQ